VQIIMDVVLPDRHLLIYVEYDILDDFGEHWR
jgi:hypothetical protein